MSTCVTGGLHPLEGVCIKATSGGCQLEPGGFIPPRGVCIKVCIRCIILSFLEQSRGNVCQIAPYLQTARYSVTMFTILVGAKDYTMERVLLKCYLQLDVPKRRYQIYCTTLKCSYSVCALFAYKSSDFLNTDHCEFCDRVAKLCL